MEKYALLRFLRTTVSKRARNLFPQVSFPQGVTHKVWQPNGFLNVFRIRSGSGFPIKDGGRIDSRGVGYCDATIT